MEGLTQEGLTYCDLMQGSANSAAWWPADASTTRDQQPALFLRAESGFLREDRKQSLAQTIEAEIIPRLMLLHVAVPVAEVKPEAIVPITELERQEVDVFCRIALNRPLLEAVNFVENLLERGRSLEGIYLKLFVSTARQLGEMWESDRCTFADVTIGLSCLQQVLQTFNPEFCADTQTPPKAPRALLIPAPGEQHTLGLQMVSQFFRRAGWEVWGNSFKSGKEVEKLVKDEWFDLVGLSAGTSMCVENMSALIREIRRQSLNRSIKIMVGGPAFIEHPELVLQVDADGMAADAQAAVQVAADLVAVPLTMK